MQGSLVINQIVCAAAAAAVLASYQGAIVSASRSRLSPSEPSKIETPAAQTVNRSAKGDKWKSLPETDPESATTPGRSRNRVIIARQYVVVPATLTGAEPSGAAPLFTLRIVPEAAAGADRHDAIVTNGGRS